MKEFLKKLFQKYKYWLYNGKSEKGDKRHSAGPSNLFFICAFLIACVFGAYYVGFFDVSFIKRPDSWESNFSAVMKSFEKESEKKDDAPPADEPSMPSDKPSKDKTVKTVDLSSTLFSKRANLGDFNFKTDYELEAEGCRLSEKTYNSDSFVLGKMTFDFSLPSKLSYGTELKRHYEVTKYDDGRMSTCEETEKESTRYAVSLYMGYMIISDEGKALYLADRDGHILMRYDQSYIPAYARTPSGKPLFYKNERVLVDVPVSSELDEAGDEVFNKFQNVYIMQKKYYTLSNSGTSFVSVEYSEEKDGRGLNFDFIDSYGLSDCDIIRCGIMYPRYSTYLNGAKNLTNFTKWNYFYKWDENIPNLEEIVEKQAQYRNLSAEERLLLKENGETPEDIYALKELLPYSYAYNYSEGYAVVVTDNTGEDPKFETEEVRVINQYGEPMFASRKSYYNTEIKDYCSDRYLLPLSKGEDSIGHLYFDNGLLRIRKVSFDQYQLDEFGDLRINSDKDILIYPNGTEFPIPDGYTLRGYSDGILLLEKNGLYGYMNTSGKWIADPEYISGEPFYGGIGVLTSDSGVCVVMDTTGKIILPMIYSYVSNRSEGLIAAYSEAEGWNIYGVFAK